MYQLWKSSFYVCREKAGPGSRVGLENSECQEIPMARQTKAGHTSQTGRSVVPASLLCPTSLF